MEVNFTASQMANLMTNLVELFEPIVNNLADKFLERVGKQAETKEPRYYTRKEVCELLGITLPTLHSYTKMGYLQAFKTGRKVLYDAWAVDEAIRTKKVYKSMRKGGLS